MSSLSLPLERPAVLKASHRRMLCLHCGTPVAKPEDTFCCSGCSYVYRLINDAGLSDYYKIKDQTTAPAEAALASARDFSWIEKAQKAAEATAGDGTPELCLDVQGISCAGCVWLIERVFTRQAGAGRAEINAQTGQMRITWQKPAFAALVFARELQSFNYLLGPASVIRSVPPESRAIAKRI